MLKNAIKGRPDISKQNDGDTSLQLGQVDELTQRSIDNSIDIIRNALRQLDDVISATEPNWIVYEILMEPRSMLRNQIDIITKEKR